jgi:hypothetical protein
LCVAVSELFTHHAYTVRIAGTSIIKDIDDDATRGIGGIFYGNSINPECDPVNQLASDITPKVIEDTIISLKTSIASLRISDHKTGR